MTKLERQVEQRDLRAGRLEVRDAENGAREIVGLIPFNSRSQKIWDWFFEIIKPSAFRKTLLDGAEVVALRNHNSDQILGSTKAGTLKLTEREDGLECVVVVPATSYASDLLLSVARGDVTTMSFGMEVIKDVWYVDENGDEVRELYEVKLFEVSFGVVFPAYKESTSTLRSYLQQRKQRMVRDYTEKHPAQPAATTGPGASEPELESEPARTTRKTSLQLRYKYLMGEKDGS